LPANGNRIEKNQTAGKEKRVNMGLERLGEGLLKPRLASHESEA